MSQQPPSVPAATDRPASLWAGATIFASGALLVSGLFGVVQGLVALLDEQVLRLGGRGLLVLDVSAWGWLHLALAVPQVVAAFGLLVGATWARAFAVVVTGVNLVAQMAYLPAYPFSAALIIGLDLLVIWAVTVHGGDIRDA
jgi:hypothetical protein